MTMGDLAQYLIQPRDMVLAILSIWGLLPVLVEGRSFLYVIYGLSFKNFVSSQYYSVRDPWVIAKQVMYVFNSNQFSIQFIIY